jgi:hypothetical protein
VNSEVKQKASLAWSLGILKDLEGLIDRVRDCRRTPEGAMSLQLLGLQADLMAAKESAIRRGEK